MAIGFHQFETEPLQLVIEQDGNDKPLEGFSKIAVSFDQHNAEGSCHIDFLFDKDDASGVDVENSTINLHFTQEQSGKFLACGAKVEVNILYEDGERVATCEGTVNIFRNLYKKVM